MGSRPKRGERIAELPVVRFEGLFWDVAMCSREWAALEGVGIDANTRLVALLRHFCSKGDDALPGRAMRWMSRSADPTAPLSGAFEAHGVVLHGRRGVLSGRDTFVVTEIIIDPPGETTRPPRVSRRSPEDVQGRLPLHIHHTGERK